MGDRKGIAAGSKIMLPNTFTGGLRGLPHCHTLLWIESRNTLKDATQIDEYISAKIPDPVQDPKGPYRILAKISNSEASTFAVDTTKQIDEIQNYVDGRFICSYEACWRIFDFLIHCRKPAVQILNVHLEDTQRIKVRKRDRVRVKGCKSPNEVRTVNGHMLPTFRVACEALGLLGDDREWDISLEESIASATSKEIIILSPKS
nr:DNA helicase PIF1, ATP-dependent [Tanacetum cinerariifolium]